MRLSRMMASSLVLTLLIVTSVTSQSTTDTPSSATSTAQYILPTGSPSSQPSPADTGNSTQGLCPGPLIPNIHGLKIKTCMGRCCIKCPAVESFYEPNKVSRVLDAAYVTRQVSLACAIFMAISYLVLPGKRSQPHISVLFLTVSLSLWYAAFDIMPGVSNACINDYEESTGSNSRLCGIQGVLIIYLTQTSALWGSLLIYKLHLLAVWRSDIIDQYYKWFTAFCWVFPLAFAIPVAVKNLSQYPGIGFSCLVSTDNLNTYLFYPIAVYIYPSLLLHTVTLGKMIHLAILSSKIDTDLSQLSNNARMRVATTMQAKRLLRGQWRPALMVGTVMTSLTVFWLFYFVDAHRLANVSATTPWLQEWVLCVLVNDDKGLSSDETQRVCARQVAHHLPSIPWFTAAEMLLAFIGIVVATVFIAKSEFWSEWAFLLKNIFSRGKLGRGSRGRRTTNEDGSYPTSPNMNKNENAHAISRQQYLYNDPSIKKGTRVGYNDDLPTTVVPRDSTPATSKELQWYDMDALLDKEYELHGANLQRNTSFGSRVGIAGAAPSQRSSMDPPRNPISGSHDLHSSDVLYRPLAPEANAWSPSAHTMANPEPTYLVASDSSDRYVEKPVVPRPVPRASLKPRSNSQQLPQEQQYQVYLSDPIHSPSFTPVSTSLSPMPPRSSGSVPATALPRQIKSESAPIVSSVKHTLSQSQPQSRSQPQSPSAAKTTFYNSNDSGDQIMIASRRSMTGATSRRVNKTPQEQLATSEPIPTNNEDDIGINTMGQQTKGLYAPTIPMKSPARQQECMSPRLQHTPLSPPNQ